MHSIVLRRRAPIALAIAISTAALLFLIHDAIAQEAPKNADAPPVAAPAESSKTAPVNAGGEKTGAELPPVNIIQEKSSAQAPRRK